MIISERFDEARASETAYLLVVPFGFSDVLVLYGEDVENLQDGVLLRSNFS